MQYTNAIYRVHNKKLSMTKIVINPKQNYITSLNLTQLIFGILSPFYKKNWIENLFFQMLWPFKKNLQKKRSGKFLYKWKLAIFQCNFTKIRRKGGSRALGLPKIGIDNLCGGVSKRYLQIFYFLHFWSYEGGPKFNFGLILAKIDKIWLNLNFRPPVFFIVNHVH